MVRGRGEERERDVQESSAENDEKANALPLGQLYLPYHLHR